MSETKLRKHQYIPFIDISGTSGDSWTPVWKRIDKSTVFELNPNPQSVTLDYIALEAPVEEIEKYQPELPQEIALYEGNPVYDFMFEKLYQLPVGSDAKVPLLMCFAGEGKKAWQASDCTVSLGALNTVDGKLSFTLKLGGSIERGTYTVTDGAPSFCA